MSDLLRDWCVCHLRIPCQMHPEVVPPAVYIEPQGNVVPIARGAWLKAQKEDRA